MQDINMPLKTLTDIDIPTLKQVEVSGQAPKLACLFIISDHVSKRR